MLLLDEVRRRGVERLLPLCGNVYASNLVCKQLLAKPAIFTQYIAQLRDISSNHWVNL